ncbi:hypothetical protein JTE90_006644 [Oedothorax gibbosus]|uniref:Uncharacterized protein n=1 Tax=Oedothorax gibbosus TaxID=931172 RepID=A0AAV6TUY5_9ARAC|nr:hypothetical protein JTE90_006644 [Oedothorax gibbosus]
MAILLDLCRDYPLEMCISDFPLDIAENKKDGAANVNSDNLESSATRVPKTLIPKTKTRIPSKEVSQPVKQTRSGRRIVSCQRLDL